MKQLLILFTLILLCISCARSPIITDIKLTDVENSNTTTLDQLLITDYSETKNPAQNRVNKSGVDPKPTLEPAETENNDVKPTKEFIPSLPSASKPKDVLVDLDYTFALVNSEVITTKDIQKDLMNYIEYLATLRKQISESPFDLKGKGSYRRMLAEAEMNAVYRNFERKMLEILYTQKAEEFKMFIGSVPEEAIEQAIQESKRQHGIFSNTKNAEKLWLEILSENNLSYFEFRQQIISQLNKQRVLWMISNHPDFRIDITLDITPSELRNEYRKNPVADITDIELYRLEIPVLPTNYSKVMKNVNKYLAELKLKLAEIDPNKQAAEFAKLTKAFFPNWEDKLEKFKYLEDEEPAIVHEIRLASKLPRLCSLVELEDKIVVIFLVNKKESKIASFSNLIVQQELFRRLTNELWNEFRRRYEKKLLHEATIIPGDLIDK